MKRMFGILFYFANYWQFLKVARRCKKFLKVAKSNEVRQGNRTAKAADASGVQQTGCINTRKWRK